MRLLTIREVQTMQLELMKKLHIYLEDRHIPYYMLAGSVLGAVRHGGFIPWDDDIDIGMLRPDYNRFLSVCGDFDGGYDIVNYHNRRHCDTCLTRICFPNTRIENPSIANTALDQRLYFDIFPLDNIPDNEAEREKLEKKLLKIKTQLLYADVRNYGNPGYVIFAKKARALLLAPRREKLLKKCDALMQSYQEHTTRCICSMCSQYSFKKQTMPRAYYGVPTLHCFEDAAFYIPERSEDYLRHLYGEDYMEIPPVERRRKGYAIYKTDED